MQDDDIAYVSPSSAYRGLKSEGLVPEQKYHEKQKSDGKMKYLIKLSSMKMYILKNNIKSFMRLKKILKNLLNIIIKKTASGH
ncbi:MAG: hypothetical protein ACOCP8_10175 [archaeon]